MNVERLIRMVLRQVMRQGVTKGIDRMSAKGKRVEDMTPAERASYRRNRENAGKARRGLGMLRRFLR